MMAAQRQRQTGLSILRRLSPATPDEDHVSPADGETNSTQPSDFVKCVNKEACASQRCSFLHFGYFGHVGTVDLIATYYTSTT